jgi:gluconolactonase
MMNADVGDPKPLYTTVVDAYDGKRLNSPNDATFAKNGDLYFTDPPYGLEQGMDDPGKELPYQGVYRMNKEGVVTLLTDELSRPNGVALSHDQKYLYVANSDPQSALWMKYTLDTEGNIAAGEVFYDATSEVANNKGLPDGLKIHPSGTIFATGPGGVWIFNEEGQHLGTIRTGEATSNCALGNNNQYLYMTADMYLMRIALK